VRARRKAVVGERLIYELGDWSEAYMAQRASEITNFHCGRCKQDFHGISMYEHFSTCSPRYFKRLSKPKDKKLEQKCIIKQTDGSIGKGTRKVEVGYVEQTGRSGFDPDGISPALHKEVLHAESEEDSGALLEDPRGKNVREDPQSYFEILRGFRNDK